MSIGRREKENNEGAVDLTPMIDMTFILLIFFMVPFFRSPSFSSCPPGIPRL